MPEKGDPELGQETYMHGHQAVVVDEHARRTADRNAAYLLPHLEPGMSLLDVGCGPGSITVGLASAVSPGQVTGVDSSEAALERARTAAHDAGIRVIEYRNADAYVLPFPDESFDAVHMHQVLQHLSEPDVAAREAIRVLKPGGVFGVTEVDWDTAVFWPSTSETDRFLEIYDAVAIKNGGDPHFGRRLRATLEPLGVSRLEIKAHAWAFGDADATRGWGDQWRSRIQESNIAAVAVESGISTRDELAHIGAGLHDWGVTPGAFFSITHGEALAWK